MAHSTCFECKRCVQHHKSTRRIREHEEHAHYVVSFQTKHKTNIKLILYGVRKLACK